MEQDFVIFLSSAHKGLEPYRRAVEEVINTTPPVAGRRLRTVMTESAGPSTRPPLKACLERVGQADVVVVLVGYRYGSVVPDDHAGRAYTEVEFDEAIRLRKPMLVFVAGTRKAFKREVMDADVDRIRAFREKVLALQDKHYTVQLFRDLDGFGHLIGRTAQGVLPELLRNVAIVGRVERSDIRLPDETVHPFDGMNEQILFGRDKDLDELDGWLADVDRAGLIIEAIGGMGKSSLAWEWYAQFAERLIASDSEAQVAGKFWWSCYHRGATLKAMGSRLRQWVETAFAQNARLHEGEDDWIALETYLGRFQHPPLVVIDGLEAEFVGYEGRRASVAERGKRRRESETLIAEFADAMELYDDEPEDGFADFIDDSAGRGLWELISKKLLKALITTRHTPESFKDKRNAQTKLKGGLWPKKIGVLSPKSAQQVFVARGIVGEPATIKRCLWAEELRHPLLLTGFAGAVVDDPVANGNLDTFMKQHPDFNLSATLRREGRKHNILTYVLRDLTALERCLLDIIATSDRPLPAQLVIKHAQQKTDAVLGAISEALLNLEKKRTLVYSSQDGENEQSAAKSKEYSMHPVYRMYLKRYRLGDVQAMAAAIRPDYEKELFAGVGRDALGISLDVLDGQVVPIVDLCITGEEYDHAWSHFPALLEAKERFGLYRLTYDRLVNLVIFAYEHGRLTARCRIEDSQTALNVLWQAGDLARLFGDIDESCACWLERERLIKAAGDTPDDVELTRNATALLLAQSYHLDCEEISEGFETLGEAIKQCQKAEALWKDVVVGASAVAPLVGLEAHGELCALQGFVTLVNWAELGAKDVTWHFSNCAQYRERARYGGALDLYYSRPKACLVDNPRLDLKLRSCEVDGLLRSGRYARARQELNQLMLSEHWKELDFSEWPEYTRLFIRMAEIEPGSDNALEQAGQIEQSLEEIIRQYGKRWKPAVLRNIKTRKLEMFVATGQTQKATLMLDELLAEIKTAKLPKVDGVLNAIESCAHRLGRQADFDDVAAGLPGAYHVEGFAPDPIYGFKPQRGRLPPMAWS